MAQFRKNVVIGKHGTTVAHNTNETNGIHGTLQTLQTLNENYKIIELTKMAQREQPFWSKSVKSM